MKFLLFLNLLLCMLFFSSCAQNRYGIQKTYAYERESFRGILPVDEKGNPLLKGSDTVHIIFIETKKEDTLIVHSAWNDKQIFSVAVFPVEQKLVEVGKRKTDEKKVIIQSSAGNRLWRLELQPLDGTNFPRSVVPQGVLILEGEYRGRNFKLEIKNQLELLPEVTG